MSGKAKPIPIKTFIVKRTVVEYYEVRSIRRKYAKDFVSGGPFKVEVIKEVVKPKET